MESTTNNSHQDQTTQIVSISVAYAAIYPPAMLLTIVANFATIYAFIKERGLREKPSDLLVLSLAGADMLLDTVILPLNAPNFILSHWPFGETLCKVLTCLSITCTEAGYMIMVAISYDRLLLISIPYPSYVRRQTQRRIYFYIGLCWFNANLLGLLELSLWDYSKGMSQAAAVIDFSYQCLSPVRRLKIAALAEFFTFILAPIISVIVLSVIFLVRLRRRLIERQQVDPLSHEQSETSMNHLSNSQAVRLPATRGTSSGISRYIKPAITLTALVAAMIICVVPYCLYIIYLGFFCPTCYDRTSVYAFVFMIYLNSLINPFLYAATQSKIRNFYRRKIRLII